MILFFIMNLKPLAGAVPGFPVGGGADPPGGMGGANIQFCQISPKTA